MRRTSERARRGCLLIHEDGIGETRLAYTAGNLLDLVGAVCSWISVVWLKTTHGPVFDPGREGNFLHVGKSVPLAIFFSASPALGSLGTTHSAVD